MDTAEKIVDLEWVSGLHNKFSRELLSKCKGDLTHNKLIEAIDVSKNYIRELRQYIKARQFGNSGDEISFFKQYKPGFYHHLFYCSEVLEIELKRPTGSNQCIRDYYLSQTNRINENFERNRDFRKPTGSMKTLSGTVIFMPISGLVHAIRTSIILPEAVTPL
jgi:hypothetical protein